MVSVCTGETVTLENPAGSRATVHIDAIHSTRIFITQLTETGTLDFTGDGYIPTVEFDRYTLLPAAE